jgi:hypothetical protein
MIKFKAVKILGVLFKVFIKPQREIAQEFGSPDVMGYCDDIEDHIVISKELSPYAMKRVFIHEWAHGVCSANGLNQTLSATVAESISQSFANALLELLEQKQVRDYLMKSTPK